MGEAVLSTYGLPPPVRDCTADLSPEILRESSYCTADLDCYVGENELRLLPEQRTHHDSPDGTGKTFITKLILDEISRHGDIEFAVVSSGIAATLLPVGRTAHSIFRGGSNAFRRRTLGTLGTLCSVVGTHQQLRDAVFPHLSTNYSDLGWLSDTAVLPRKKKTNLIEATILTVYERSETVFIPRTHLSPSGSDVPFTFCQSRFPTSVIFVSHCYYTAPDKHFLPPALGVFALLLDFSVKPSCLLPLSTPLHHDHLRCEGINNCVKRPPSQMHR
ncbi:unnamed protein product [Acanthosepion pharaonis]|uniref:ATP-dependent DNA helicase n=1 Tax=Acanthosepion pharaonis TaxID=158019 RepID=A0A812E5F7_ACAPH|nr:unnamed protein product [Sepia pharaonis]